MPTNLHTSTLSQQFCLCKTKAENLGCVASFRPQHLYSCTMCTRWYLTSRIYLECNGLVFAPKKALSIFRENPCVGTSWDRKEAIMDENSSKSSTPSPLSSCLWNISINCLSMSAPPPPADATFRFKKNYNQSSIMTFSFK